MPELPEVETIVRGLNKNICGKKISKLKILGKNILQSSVQKISKEIINQKIKKVSRYGKYIIFELGSSYFWVVHLRMTGKFIYPADKNTSIHDRALFELNDKTFLAYNDLRCFGTMELLKKDTALRTIKNLGLDALDPKWTKEMFYQKLRGKKLSIKDLLLEQSQIAGVGNIYASEILFDAKISPLRVCNEIIFKESTKILRSINFILRLAIEKNGTSISDYRTIDDKTGEFQNFLKVYGKKHSPCRRSRCTGTIEKIKQRQRSTFFCPSCQF